MIVNMELYRDGAQKTAAGSGFFDYGDLSKFLIQVPVSSWNSKITQQSETLLLNINSF